jgi:hypothetical protein
MPDDEILKMPERPDPPARPTKHAMALGVTENHVRDCMAAIDRDGLDLRACIDKGGAWEVAAKRIAQGRKAAVLRRAADRLVDGVTPEYLAQMPDVIKKLASPPGSRLKITDDDQAPKE